jgi:hypothetical protein
VASLNSNDPNNNNAWIQLDFGASRVLQSVKWQGAATTPYPAWSPTNYSIQISGDGISWQAVVTRSNSAPVVNGNEPLNAQARFLRMLTNKVGDGTGWSLSFFEFWAEGPTSPPPPSPLSITTSTLVSSTVGVAYNSPLTATGGTTPYSWSIASGTLPTGLTLSSAGVISGTPSQSGSSPFTAGVTDLSSPAQTATKALTLSVAAPPPTVARLAATVATSSAAAGYPASYAGDGNTTTQWVASLTPDPNNNNNAWIQLDFGTSRALQSVKWQGAVFTPYPAWSPTNYSIQISADGISWQTVVTRSNSAPVVNGNEPLNVQARFLRMLTSKVGDGSGWSLSFFEFWAEGS